MFLVKVICHLIRVITSNFGLKEIMVQKITEISFPVGEDYLNYFDRYSDTSIVWLSWDGNEGRRVTIQNTVIPGLTDTLFTHTAFEHFEQDERLWYYDAVAPRVQLPFWQENKVWTWHFLGNGGSIDFNFTQMILYPILLLM